MANDIPVLIISFNRPEKTKAAINNIRKLKPSLIFYTVDGPRQGEQDDLRKVEECKKLVEEIDWECEIETLFSEINFGSGKWPIKSINWAIKKVKYLMIIEDDVVVSKEFYSSGFDLLQRYEKNNKIFAICASNISINLGIKYKYDYYFTKYFSGWGWIIWADKWKKYDFEIKKNNRVKFKSLLKINNYNVMISIYFYLNLVLISKGYLQAWDYQVNNLVFRNNYLNIKFTKNLSENSGIGSDATHTKNMPVIKIKKMGKNNIIHPPSVKITPFLERKWRHDRLKFLFVSIKKKFIW